MTTTDRRRTAWGLAGLVLLRASVDVLRLVSQPGTFRDGEEAYNATVGYVAWTSGLFDRMLDLQYARFCGGCTVIGGLAAPLLGLGGDRFLLWKSLAVLWGAGTLLAGFAAADRWVGRKAAWAFAAMLALPPPGLAEISLLLWGNHQETSLLVLGSLALVPTDPVAAALLAGASVWFCRTALYGAIVAVGAALALHPARRRAIAAAAAAGLALLAVPAGMGATLGYRMDVADNVLPDGPGEGVLRAVRLLDPTELVHRLFGGVHGPLTVPLTALVVAVAAAGVGVQLAERERGPRRLVLAVLPGVFALAWSVTGFSLHDPQSLFNVRYYAPWLMLLLLSAAAGFGPWLDRDGWRRRVAAGALAAPLGAGVVGLVAAVAHARVDPEVWTSPATDLAKFASVAALRLDHDRLVRATSTDPRVERTLRRLEGRDVAVRQAGGVLDLSVLKGRPPETFVGFGMGLAPSAPTAASLGDVVRWLATLPEDEAGLVGRGVARALVDPVSAPGVRWPASFEEQRRLLLAGSAGPCWLCAAAGPGALDGCAPEGRRPEGGRVDPETLAACLLREIPAADAPEVLVGAGWVLNARLVPAGYGEALARALPADLRDDLEAGMADPTVTGFLPSAEPPRAAPRRGGPPR